MKKINLLTAFAPIGVVLMLSPVGAPAQTQFFQVTDHPVFSYGPPGAWDDGALWQLSVIKDGDTLRMWYEGRDGSTWDSGNARIGYAWSLDGVEWHRYAGNPVLTPDLPWERGYVGFCTVIKDGDLFKMWYSSDPRHLSFVPQKIGYAFSSDGIHWTKHSEPVLELGPPGDWDDAFLGPATVINEGGLYKMWYWGADNPIVNERTFTQTGLATSTDGINWVKYDDPSTADAPFSHSDPVLKVGESGEWDSARSFLSRVLPTEDGYEMFYTGLTSPFVTGTKQQIGYATSSDGISWQKWPENPVLSVYPKWGELYYGGPVIDFDGKYHLWYAMFHTYPTRAIPQIGYAISPKGIDRMSNLAVSPIYAKPGRDTIRVSVEAQNSQPAAELTILAEIQESDESPAATMHLFDDGAHDDGAADDGLFANRWPVPSIDEQHLNVDLDVKLVDADTVQFRLSNAAMFTTIGPVEVAGLVIISPDSIPNPGDLVFFRLPLRNDGLTAAATDVRAEITTSDTCIQYIQSRLSDYGDIPAGELGTSVQFFLVKIDANCPGDVDVVFDVAITSEGTLFWEDQVALHVYRTPSGVATEGRAVPTEFVLHQSFPNPFSPARGRTTAIGFDLPDPDRVELVIYNTLGQAVRKLVDGEIAAGTHSIAWDGRDYTGAEVASGVYLYRIQAGAFTAVRKLVLAR